jgi:hypothetical protein
MERSGSSRVGDRTPDVDRYVRPACFTLVSFTPAYLTPAYLTPAYLTKSISRYVGSGQVSCGVIVSI